MSDGRAVSEEKVLIDQRMHVDRQRRKHPVGVMKTGFWAVITLSIVTVKSKARLQASRHISQ
jgi:hypothetical protein